MKFFLFLLIVALGAGGYYGYTQLIHLQTQQQAANQKQFDDLQDRLGKIETANKAEADNQAQAASNAAPAQPPAPAPDAQAATGTTTTTNDASATPPADAAADDFTTHLGTITTLDGKTYQSCQLIKIDADGITINHADGVTKITFAMLPTDLQKKFGFDINHAVALTEAQIRYEEQKRKAAEDAGK
jgi:3-oxoacyl-ACP reductase-like protein